MRPLNRAYDKEFGTPNVPICYLIIFNKDNALLLRTQYADTPVCNSFIEQPVAETKCYQLDK